MPSRLVEIFIPACIVCMGLATASGLTENGSAAVMHNSVHEKYRNVLGRIQKTYEESVANIRLDTKDGWVQRNQALSELIKKLSEGETEILHDGILHEVATSGFEQDVTDHLLLLDIARGRREEAVIILSRRAERSIFFSPIEYCLATGSAYEFGITVLHDSYWCSQSEDNRAVIAKALRCAFPDLTKAYSNDADFVRESRWWYWNKRSTVVVNRHYPLAFAGDSEDGDGKTALFVESLAMTDK
jgi:hypothetical protein